MRYSGTIGIKAAPVETSPGIWSEPVAIHNIFGQIRLKGTRWTQGELSQDKVRANHIVSIIGPESLVNDFSEALWITWQGIKWTVTTVEYARPRINLTLGAPYNGD